MPRSIYRANKTTDKKAPLDTFLDEFELLKLEIRLCTDLEVLSFKKQAELSVLMDSIGKQSTRKNVFHVTFLRTLSKNYKE